MLDRNDLQAIADLISASEIRLIDRMDARNEELKEELIVRMDNMNEKLKVELTDRMDQMDKRLSERIDQMNVDFSNRIDTLESELYDEMDRYDRQNQRSFNEVKERLQRLESTYRISKNESDTITLLVKSVQNLQIEITNLKQIIA